MSNGVLRYKSIKIIEGRDFYNEAFTNVEQVKVIEHDAKMQLDAVEDRRVEDGDVTGTVSNHYSVLWSFH